MSELILFSNDCPKCKTLEALLTRANIAYTKTDNFEEVIQQGYMSAPVLKVDGKFLDFSPAVAYIKQKEKEA